VRDLHKVREQEGIVLSRPQVYVLVGLLAIVACLVFIFGYYVGRRAPVVVATDDASLIPEDVKRESVALLLARAAEEEAERVEEPGPELEFHEVLSEGEDLTPERRGTPTPAPVNATPTPRPVGNTPTPRPVGNTPTPKLAGAGAAMSDEAETVRTPEPTASASKPDETASEPIREEPADEEVTPTPRPEGRREAGSPAGDTRSIAQAGPASSDGAERVPEQASASKPAQETRQEARTGTAPGATTTAPSPSGGAPAHAPASRQWSAQYAVQVSSFKDPSVADRLVRQLQAKGFAAYRVAADINGKTWYRVRVGPFPTRPDAEAERGRLREARPDLKPMITRE